MQPIRAKEVSLNQWNHAMAKIWADRPEPNSGTNSVTRESSQTTLRESSQTTCHNGRTCVALDDINILLEKAVNNIKTYNDEREQALRTFIQHELKCLENVMPMLVRSLNSSEAQDAKPELARYISAEYDKAKASKDGEAEVHTANAQADSTLYDMDDNNAPLSSHDLYMKAIERNTKDSSIWHDILGMLLADGLLPTEPPDTCLARSTEHWSVKLLSFLAIMSNTALMAYGTDHTVNNVLNESPGDKAYPNEFVSIANQVLTIIFVVELLYRMIALRLWFWVAPGEWTWNLFDLFLVGVSSLTSLLGTANLSFARSLRLIRVARVARVVRVVRFFRELRKMLLSIIACLKSLAWALLFLMIVQLMVSIFFIQGVVMHFELNPELVEVERDEFMENYSSVLGCMRALLQSILGADWVAIQAPLVKCGRPYTVTFMAYIFFVNVGIMNVLTGVFLSSAADFVDRDLQVQDENAALDRFVKAMLSVFEEVADVKSGTIHKDHFYKIVKDGPMEAFLAFEGLEPLHSCLLWDLLDVDNSGTLTVAEFIVGLMRMKGDAKAIDARVIQRSLKKLPKKLGAGSHTSV